MKRLVASALLGASLTIGGCVSPLVQPAAPTLQKKVASAANVQQLASSSAQRFAQRVKTAEKPLIYVAPGPADMPFASQFKDELEEALMARGYTISQTAVGAEVLNFEVQPFLYGSDRQKHLVEYASFWTTWANIGYQVSQMNDAIGSQFAIAGVLGPIFDALDAMDQTTRAEVVIKMSVMDANRLYYADTQSIYVPPADLRFYMTALPKMSPQMMAVDAALPVVALRVSGGY